MEEAQQVLIVEDDADFAAILAESLAPSDGADGEFATRHVGDLSKAQDAVATEDWSAILLDLNLPDSTGMSTLKSLHEIVRAPIVVVTGTRDDRFANTAIRNGAHDLVVKGDLRPDAMRLVVRHAIARHRHYASWIEQLGQMIDIEEIDHLTALTGPRPSSVAGRALGLGSIAETAPDVYADITGMYADLLEMSVDRSAYKDGVPTDTEADRIARAMGFAGAGPRDVVDVHTAALRGRLDQASPGARRAYVAEGRNVLVQVMGYLASYYRARAVRTATPRPTTPDTNGGGSPQ